MDFTLPPRQLTDEERKKLDEHDACLVSDFQRSKLEKEAKKNWDLFYKRNKDHFFKDRHWTMREFSELIAKNVFRNELDTSAPYKTLLEIGCGVGNFIFPLLENDQFGYFVYACDFSPVAIDLLQKNPAYDESRCKAFVDDVTNDSFVENWSCNGFQLVDIITLIFVLSSISPEKMNRAVENIYKILNPGGIVLFRDYGIYDHAMIRFSEGHKISENFYVRQDGTRAFYFTKEYVLHLFKSNGFQELSNDYVRKVTINKKEGISVPRIFVQARFVKPS